MNSGIWWWVGALMVVAAVVAFFVIRRQRYLAALAERGWQHDPNPQLDRVWDHQAPPFGLGWSREPDELITGTTPSGISFRVFSYVHQGAGPRFKQRIASLAAAQTSLPVYLAAPGGHRVGILGPESRLEEISDGTFSAVSQSPQLAADVLGRASAGLAQLAGLGRVDLSLEPAGLVATGAPKDPEELATWLAVLDGLAQSLHGIDPAPISPQPGFTFHRHPDWRHLGADTSVLATYPVSGGGFDHTVENLVRGERDGIRLDAFTHHWKTQRTEVYTDSQGRTQTRTVTDFHDEAVCGFTLPFQMPAISVNGRRIGQDVNFESEEFNRVFEIRSENPRFASDVTHPRMMEWLLATRPRGWTVTGQTVVFVVGSHDQFVVEACEATLRGWLGRIPRFVWQDLQLAPPPFLVE